MFTPDKQTTAKHAQNSTKTPTFAEINTTLAEAYRVNAEAASLLAILDPTPEAREAAIESISLMAQY
jgi:hypothetical protein